MELITIKMNTIVDELAVSIIMPMRNAARWLHETLLSVEKQTFRGKLELSGEKLFNVLEKVIKFFDSDQFLTMDLLMDRWISSFNGKNKLV